jgi:lambda family phage portal protein
MSFLTRQIGALKSAVRAYYAAANVGRLNGHFQPYLQQSPNVPINTDWRVLLARVRQGKRDNPIVRGAIRSLRDNILPTPIMVQPDVKFADGTEFPEGTAALERMWNKWCSGHCDFDGWDSHRQTFDMLVGKALMCTITDGELFNIVRFRKTAKGLPGIQIELSERDRLGLWSGLTGYDRREGCEYDANGRIIAYTFRKSLDYAQQIPERIPARYVIHCMVPDRPQMDNGDIALACVLNPVNDLGEMVTSEIQIKALLSRIAGIVTGGNANPFGATTPTVDGQGNAVRRLDIDQGVIWQLDPGATFTDAVGSNRPGVNFESFVSVIQRVIAVGIGLPYETISGDWTKTTYSGGRMAWQQCQPMISFWRRSIVRDQLVRPIYEAFVNQALAEGLLPIPASGDVDWYNATYNLPGYRYVDPQKEIAAQILAIEAGLTSPQRVCAEMGVDAWQVADENKDFRAYLLQPSPAGSPGYALETTAQPVGVVDLTKEEVPANVGT